jgi:hypothetical protein
MEVRKCSSCVSGREPYDLALVDLGFEVAGGGVLVSSAGGSFLFTNVAGPQLRCT